MKRLLKSKKAMVLYYITIPGFALGLLMFYLATLNATDSDINIFIGETQLGLIQKSQEAQKYTLFIDQAAKISAESSITELANNGGFAVRSPCGTYLDYSLWTSSDKQCYPDYRTELRIILGKNLDTSLALLKDIPDTDYYFFIKEDKIIGIADTDIVIELRKDGQKLGEYSINPSFNIKTEHNVDNFREIEDQAAILLKNCKDQPKLEDCILDNLPSGWEAGTCENDLAISEKRSAFCIRQQGLTYRFALDFS
jgi:hypothetical protein